MKPRFLEPGMPTPQLPERRPLRFNSRRIHTYSNPGGPGYYLMLLRNRLHGAWSSKRQYVSARSGTTSAAQ